MRTMHVVDFRTKITTEQTMTMNLLVVVGQSLHITEHVTVHRYNSNYKPRDLSRHMTELERYHSVTHRSRLSISGSRPANSFSPCTTYSAIPVQLRKELMDSVLGVVSTFCMRHRRLHPYCPSTRIVSRITITLVRSDCRRRNIPCQIVSQSTVNGTTRPLPVTLSEVEDSWTIPTSYQQSRKLHNRSTFSCIRRRTHSTTIEVSGQALNVFIAVHPLVRPVVATVDDDTRTIPLHRFHLVVALVVCILWKSILGMLHLV